MDSDVVPKQVCIEAANAISSLVRSYRQLYTLRRTPSLVPYMIFASSVMHLIATDSRSTPLTATTQVKQDIAALNEMGPCHIFAKRARQILVRMADNWSVSGPQTGLATIKRDDDDADCVLQSSSMNFFCPDMECMLPTSDPSQTPLFSPFTTQGIPLLAMDKELEAAGFTF